MIRELKLLLICFISLNFLISALVLKGSAINQGNTDDNPEIIEFPFDNEEFIFGNIEVISEPIVGSNINVGVSSNPKIAIEENKMYVVWEDMTEIYGAGSDMDIFFKYFDGNNWSEIQIISEPVWGSNINTGGSYHPDITVENGNIYVVWDDYTNINNADEGDLDIFFRCNLSGTGWEDIQVISEPIFGNNLNTEVSRDPTIAVNNGKLFVVWADENNTDGSGQDRDIFYRTNLSGSNWDEIQVISEPIRGNDINIGNSFSPEIAIDNENTYVTWHDTTSINGAGIDMDIFYRCNLTGFNWEDIQIISEPFPGKNTNTAQSLEPSITVNNSKIYIVWIDLNNTNGAGTDSDIFFKCNITGFSWEQVQVISEPLINLDLNVENSYSPSICTENGAVYVVWADKNSTNNAGTDWDIFLRFTTNNLIWKDIKIISEPIFNLDYNIGDSEYPDIVTDSNKCHILWHDNNNTNGANIDKDIFYRWVEVPQNNLFFSLPVVNPILGNTSTEFNLTVKYHHLNNIPPTEIIADIDDKEYSMIEIDTFDTNYIDGKEYYFNINNLDIGTHAFFYRADDGTTSITSNIFNLPTVINTPPLIITENNLTAYEDEPYYVDYDYVDIDKVNVGQQIDWNWKTDASWLYFSDTTGVLNGTPRNDDVGDYWVNISVFDTIDTDSTNFTLTVININDNPIIMTDNVEFTYEDELYEVDYDSMDVDSLPENQEWMLETNASSWLTMDSDTGILSGIPSNDDVGTYWVNVSVHDGIGGLGFTNFTLTVLNVNDPPVITTEDITLASVGILYEVKYNATDIDSPISNFEWYLTSNASWLSIDSTSGLLSGTPTDFDTGLFHVNVTVHDGDSGFDWHDFSIGVTKIPINAPPVITTKDTLTAIVGELYYIDYEAIDDRTPVNELLWDIRTNASWLTVEKTTGVLKGTPTVNDVGWYWLNLSVYDGEGGKTYHNFTITVYSSHDLVPIPNTAPTLFESLLSPLSGRIDTDFTFSVRYFDLDGDPPAFIQIVLDGIRYNMTFTIGNISNGIYEYRTRLSEGEHIYHFTASDGEYMVNTDNFTTAYIEKEGEVSTGKMSNWVWMLVIIVVIVIVVAVMFFMIIRKKRRKEETLIPEPITLRPTLRPTPPITAGYAASRPKPSQTSTVTTLKAPLTTQHLPGQEFKDHLMLPPSQSEPLQKQQIQDLNQIQSQQQQQLQTPHIQQPRTSQQNQQIPAQQPPTSGEKKLEGWDIQ